MSDLVYLNGDFIPAANACIPVLDRGFLFGDSVYEVVPVYGGQPFRLEAHLERFSRSLAALDMAEPLAGEQWREVVRQLVARNGMPDALVYAQVTRGVGKVRDHGKVEGLTPTVFARVSAFPTLTPAQRAAGMSAITLEDIRWRRCDIKATTLLANVLARKQAYAENADEAILIRDGLVTEGAASNVFVVLDGLLITPPKTHEILAGITRDVVLELADEAGLPFAEAALSAEDLMRAGEIWITSSSKEVLPVVRLNGSPVGTGQAGAQWRRINDLFTVAKARA